MEGIHPQKSKEISQVNSFHWDQMPTVFILASDIAGLCLFTFLEALFHTIHL